MLSRKFNASHLLQKMMHKAGCKRTPLSPIAMTEPSNDSDTKKDNEPVLFENLPDEQRKIVDMQATRAPAKKDSEFQNFGAKLIVKIVLKRKDQEEVTETE